MKSIIIIIFRKAGIIKSGRAFHALLLLAMASNVHGQTLTSNPSMVIKTTTTFTVRVSYAETMNQIAANYPVLTFKSGATRNPVDVSNVLTNPQASWTNALILEIVYTVNTFSNEKFDNVFIVASGGMTTAGLPGPEVLGGDFNIDLANPDGSLSCTPANLVAGNTEFTIDITYTAPMLTSADPVISFTPDASLILATNQMSWIDNKHFRAKYTVTAGEDNGAGYNIKAVGSKLPDGTAIGDVTGSFSVDFVKPNCTVSTDPGNLGPVTTEFTVNIVYTEEMNTGTSPGISFSDGFSPTPTASGTGWSQDAKTYAAKYSVTLSDQKVQSIITVANAKDRAGNIQNPNNAYVLDVDQRKAILKTAAMEPATINRATTSATLTLTFDNADAMSSTAPVIAFTPDVSSTLTASGSGSWSGLVYKQPYTVNAGSTSVINGISVTVSGAKDSKGNTVETTAKTNVLDIDMAEITCKSVTFENMIIKPEDGTFVVTVEYQGAMSTAKNPKIEFVDASNNIRSSVANMFSSVTYLWTSNTVCKATYTLKTGAQGQLQALNVHARISEANTAGGSPQSKYTSINTFMVDTEIISATVTANPQSVVCSDTYLELTVAFDQVMKPMEETFNITGLADYDYVYDFLKFEKTVWSADARTAVALYRVHSDKISPNTSVTVFVSNVETAGGRVFRQDYPGTFTAESTPPTIDDNVFTSPLCHNEETGNIALTVSGGNPAYSYEWSKDGESPATGNSSTINNLGAGQYQIKVYGTDRCFASVSGTLDNPEAIVLTATVVQNVLRKDDGIIQMEAEGGTTPYTYYANNVPYSESLIEHLPVGTYQLEVDDVNDCSATAQAVITDQRAPTAFTPNGDGHNDVFMAGLSVKIFDRNGTLLFEGDNGWDGKYKGTVMRPAVYFYIVTFPDGTVRKGTIQIVKK